jgi:hypothetical protein
MRVGIMQPYFFPYIGYFQLIASVDLFVVYDNIKFTKKGWINRNRFLLNGNEASFSLALKAGSDSLSIIERELSPEFSRSRLFAQLHAAYRRAPYYTQTIDLIERVLMHPETNLFRFLFHSLVQTCQHLGIHTAFRISSSVPIDHGLRAQDKVIALCNEVGATTYINPIGGTELYDGGVFAQRGLRLQFIQSTPFNYPQFGRAFVPWLSIIDVMMFCSPTEIQQQLSSGFQLKEAAA